MCISRNTPTLGLDYYPDQVCGEMDMACVAKQAAQETACGAEMTAFAEMTGQLETDVSQGHLTPPSSSAAHPTIRRTVVPCATTWCDGHHTYHLLTILDEQSAFFCTD